MSGPATACCTRTQHPACSRALGWVRVGGNLSWSAPRWSSFLPTRQAFDIARKTGVGNTLPATAPSRAVA